MRIEDITDGYWWVRGNSGKIKIGEVWRQPEIADQREAARIRFIGDDFDYRLEACLHSGDLFQRMDHAPDFSNADRLAGLRQRYTEMGLDDESVELAVHYCLTAEPTAEPQLLDVHVVNPKGERTGRMIWKPLPWVVRTFDVSMTPINLREENDRSIA
jgi:hypothetical protein